MMKTSQSWMMKSLATVLAVGTLAVSSVGIASAATWASKTSPQNVHNGSKLVGQSYGSYTGKTSLGGGSQGTKASGWVRDRSPGNETIYVRLTVTNSARSTTTRDHNTERYNDSAWTAVGVSAWHAVATSKVDLRTCEDIRFWVDPCSSAKRVWTK